ncbi:hypothetical protein [Nocardioides sp.]|uniref:hypothetical protein n=1 Tax=Nocardioides sp. TaxID=35761 RepID=UPI001A197425|nr:hypothetical protein [Nocardioides sp.]MBJ7358545.1 hypothetical protein [Nocardioides sp.]
MNRRVIGLFLVVLLLGAGAGYAWGAARPDEGPSRFSDAAPLPAESPSVPVEPERPYAEDIDLAALQTDLEYARETIGAAPFQYSFRRPKGWSATDAGSGERKFRPPGGMEGGYGMRVKIVNARLTPEDMVEEKLGGLEATEDDVEVVGRSSDYLAVTYRSAENRLRYNTFRWFTDPGGIAATFETSVYGRERDVAGLRDLLDTVAASVERVTTS